MDEGDVGDGSILVALRQAVGVGQPEIQERTKISFDYIRSMETNQFDRLPKVVYVRGFMRSYLRYLNVPNPEKIVSAYVARLEAWQAGQK
jgi:cytoskeletal protein RodZ